MEAILKNIPQPRFEHLIHHIIFFFFSSSISRKDGIEAAAPASSITKLSHLWKNTWNKKEE